MSIKTGTPAKGYVAGVLLLTSLLGAIALFFRMHNGMGLLLDDSMVYINTARNILNGFGFYENNYFDFGRTAMTHYAPLYPAVIALISAFGIEPLFASRLLNPLLFGANIFCIGIIIKTSTSSGKAALIGAILAMMSESMLHLHCLVVSEPLFLFFFLLSVILLSRYITTHKTFFLVLSSLTLSFSFCARYAGLALVLTEITALMLFCKTPVIQRSIDTITVMIISCAPMGLWIVRNFLVSGNPFNRSFLFYMDAPKKLMLGLLNIVQWVFPGQRLPMVTVPLVSICICALAVLFLRPLKTAFARTGNRLRQAARIAAPDTLSRILLLFVAVYLFFLVLSMSTFDHETPFDKRIQLPIFVSSLILSVGFCVRAISRQWKSPAVRTLFLACIFIVCFSYVLTGMRWLTKDANSFSFFSIKPWRTSEIISAVKELPPGALLYSNEPSILWLYCDNPACMLPWHLCNPDQIDPGADSEKWAARCVLMKKMLQERRATVVWLDTISFEIYSQPTSLDSILAYYRLAPILRCADGALYRLAQ
jgi:hypothetical protein